MSISIAVVICRKEEFGSAVEIARTAAEIKELLKKAPGSAYLINRRKSMR
jgi:hypothetical protein